MRTQPGQMPRCVECGRAKKPVGRSVAPITANGYCDDDCEGYRQPPMPDYLWPGETPEEFGYPVPEYGADPTTPQPQPQ